MGRALEDERIGLVFSPREIRVESEVGDEGRSWSEQLLGRPHERFDGLKANNDGHALFEQLVKAEIQENWVGEPTAGSSSPGTPSKAVACSTLACIRPPTLSSGCASCSGAVWASSIGLYASTAATIARCRPQTGGQPAPGSIVCGPSRLCSTNRR